MFPVCFTYLNAPTPPTPRQSVVSAFGVDNRPRGVFEGFWRCILYSMEDMKYPKAVFAVFAFLSIGAAVAVGSVTPPHAERSAASAADSISQEPIHCSLVAKPTDTDAIVLSWISSGAVSGFLDGAEVPAEGTIFISSPVSTQHSLVLFDTHGRSTVCSATVHL